MFESRFKIRLFEINLENDSVRNYSRTVNVFSAHNFFYLSRVIIGSILDCQKTLRDENQIIVENLIASVYTTEA